MSSVESVPSCVVAKKRAIDGILLLNKPIGCSSNAALQQVKRLYHAKKAGHTGSLDPLATGVLPICFGEATKFSGYLLDADKTYTAWGRLGCTSSTGDAEGQLTTIENAPIISSLQFEENLKSFLGQIKQIPPIYSALKKDGVPLYKLAREGKILSSDIAEEKARWITIYTIELIDYQYPNFEIKVTCSKGTYIRTLIQDIGFSLNSGAYLLNLRRDKAGTYQIEKSYTIEQLKAYDPTTLDSLLMPMDTAVLNYPALVLDKQQVMMLRQGKVIDLSSNLISAQESLVRLYDTDTLFLGLGCLSADNSLRVKRLVAQ